MRRPGLALSDRSPPAAAAGASPRHAPPTRNRTRSCWGRASRRRRSFQRLALLSASGPREGGRTAAAHSALMRRDGGDDGPSLGGGPANTGSCLTGEWGSRGLPPGGRAVPGCSVQGGCRRSPRPGGRVVPGCSIQGGSCKSCAGVGPPWPDGGSSRSRRLGRGHCSRLRLGLVALRHETKRVELGVQLFVTPCRQEGILICQCRTLSSLYHTSLIQLASLSTVPTCKFIQAGRARRPGVFGRRHTAQRPQHTGGEHCIENTGKADSVYTAEGSPPPKHPCGCRGELLHLR